MTLLLGYDIGSSAVKAALIDAGSGKRLAAAASPDEEMTIHAPRPGWAEQDPQLWWEHVKLATGRIDELVPGSLKAVEAIGISYQMHGLVVVDRNHEVLRPAIIWCDSRSVEIGEEAAGRIGREVCLEKLLNLPGNFTASKLRWVKDNEPSIYERIHKAMLPGDYIAMRMTGEIRTTVTGLSEAILWDFGSQEPARFVLDHHGLRADIFPEALSSFSNQGSLHRRAADDLGLNPGVAVSYRAGDQPNNAFSLNVLEPGEIAATAGTSGVVFGVTDQLVRDERSRINTFVHVNHEKKAPRYGALLCINGTGSLNSWLKGLLFGRKESPRAYDRLNEMAAQVPAGSDGLLVLPYGNGAERVLDNREIGASISGINFNIHRRGHLARAVQEGIVFALNHGLQIMRRSRIDVRTVRAGRANMFLSPLFRTLFATTTRTRVELYNTDGAEGAARGAGVGAGIFGSTSDAFRNLEKVDVIEPDPDLAPVYDEIYANWSRALEDPAR